MRRSGSIAASTAFGSTRSTSSCTIPPLHDDPPAPDDGTPRTRPYDFQQRHLQQVPRRYPAVSSSASASSWTGIRGPLHRRGSGRCEFGSRDEALHQRHRALPQRVRLQLSSTRTASRPALIGGAVDAVAGCETASAGRAGHSPTTMRRESSTRWSIEPGATTQTQRVTPCCCSRACAGISSSTRARSWGCRRHDDAVRAAEGSGSDRELAAHARPRRRTHADSLALGRMACATASRSWLPDRCRASRACRRSAGARSAFAARASRGARSRCAIGSDALLSRHD